MISAASFLSLLTISIANSERWAAAAAASASAASKTLQTAIAKGEAEMVKKLIEDGAEVNNYGYYVGIWEPLKLAMETKNEEVINLLIDNGAEVDDLLVDGKRPIHVAVLSALPGVVRNLVNHKADVNAFDRRARTHFSALHWAAVVEDVDMVSLLLSLGADQNIRNDSNMTPLMVGAKNHAVDVVRVLLKAGADPDVVTRKHRESALSFTLGTCGHERYYGMIDMLLRSGADMDIEIGRGGCRTVVEDAADLAVKGAMNGKRILHAFLQAGSILSEDKARKLASFLYPSLYGEMSGISAGGTSEGSVVDADKAMMKLTDMHVASASSGMMTASPPEYANTKELIKAYEECDVFSLYRVAKRGFSKREISRLENAKYYLMDVALAALWKRTYMRTVPMEISWDSLLVRRRYDYWRMERAAWHHALASNKLRVPVDVDEANANILESFSECVDHWYTLPTG